MRYFILFLYAATIPAANWMISNVGTMCIPDGPCLIPVGFGLMAPSGVLLIGVALVLRDFVHEQFGAKFALFAVLIGAAISLSVSPAAIAIASAAAFLFSELADWAVYSRLRARGMALAVLASGLVGSVIDSVLFVFIAFGGFDFAAGNTLAKIYASIVVAAVIFFWKRNSGASE